MPGRPRRANWRVNSDDAIEYGGRAEIVYCESSPSVSMLQVSVIAGLDGRGHSQANTAGWFVWKCLREIAQWRSSGSSDVWAPVGLVVAAFSIAAQARSRLELSSGGRRRSCCAASSQGHQAPSPGSPGRRKNEAVELLNKRVSLLLREN